jgi:hypothetical protein
MRRSLRVGLVLIADAAEWERPGYCLERGFGNGDADHAVIVRDLSGRILARMVTAVVLVKVRAGPEPNDVGLRLAEAIIS